MRSNKQMQNEMTERETLEPEMAGSVDAAHEISETNPTHAELEQVKGERDQLLDRLARLQAEFDNARKREIKERADSRDYAISNTV
jgi:molecular chaperone GrpE